MNNDTKIYVIIGNERTTGSGKTNVSIELAKLVNGEIINADAIQLYKGLDIVTAKIKKDEMQDIPHHLLNFIDPLDDTWNAYTYKKETTIKIKEIQSRNKTPIIIGGTLLYIQSLLWENYFIENENNEKIEIVEKNKRNLNPISHKKDNINENVYEKLKLIDPIMANKLHPNDTRRITKCIDKFESTGFLPSDSYIKENKEQKSNMNTSPFNQKNVIIFWTFTEKQTLYERLDRRIDNMVKDGLLNEVKDLYSYLIKYKDKDHIFNNKGISQAIGWKEFQPYLIQESNASDYSKNSKCFITCINTLKKNTRNYAKRQLNWIKNKILTQDKYFVYKLNTTDISKWNDNIIELVKNIINKNKLETNKIVHCNHRIVQSDVKKWEKHICTLCNKTLNGNHEWLIHLKTKQHKYFIRKSKAMKIVDTS